MPEIFREIEGEVEAFEAACEALFDAYRPLVFDGVNGERVDWEVAV